MSLLIRFIKTINLINMFLITIVRWTLLFYKHRGFLPVQHVNSWISSLRTWVFSLSIILFLFYTIGRIEQLDIVISALSALAIGLALPTVGRTVQIMTLFFVAAGTWLVINQGTTFYDYILIYGDMLYLLTLFAMLPVLALPIRIGDYTKAIDYVFSKHVRSTFASYTLISSVSYMMGVLLNLAAVPMVYHSVKTSVERLLASNREKFLSVAIVHGYVLPVIWTPLSGVVGVFVALTHVNWLSIAAELVIISLCGLLFNWIFFYFTAIRKNVYPVQERSIQINTVAETEATAQLEDNLETKRKLIQIGIAVVSLILLIVGIDHYFHIGLVLTATLIAVPFAWIWSLLIRKGKECAQGTAAHFKKYIPTMSEQFAIFLSAAFFAQSIKFSHLDVQINEFLLGFSHWTGDNVFLVLLPLVPLLFSFLGMHPIVTATLLAQALDPAVLGLSPEDMTVALLGGAVLTFYIGPFSGTLGVMSSLIRFSSFRILTWNLWQCFAFYVIVALFLIF